MLPQSEERYILYFCKECHWSIFNMNSNALFLLRNKSAQTTLPLGNFLFETVLIDVKLRWNFNAINVIKKKKKKKRQPLLSDGSFSRAALHDLQFKMILILVHAINLKEAVYT